METPSKQPESSSMTHEEEEEMQHDIKIMRPSATNFTHTKSNKK